jgi:hypothetical protein
VSTKTADSEFVSETELSEEALSKYGDQEWKIQIKRRLPRKNEEREKSFTSVKIDKIQLPYR